MNTSSFRSFVSRPMRCGSVILISVLVSIGLVTTSASAQVRGRQTFHVPFEFVVGTTTCPAGVYTVKTESPGLLSIANSDRSAKALFLAQLESGGEASDRALLVFNRYGDSHFLSQMHPSDQTIYLKLRPSATERLIARSWAQKRNTIIATVEPSR